MEYCIIIKWYGSEFQKHKGFIGHLSNYTAFMLSTDNCSSVSEYIVSFCLLHVVAVVPDPTARHAQADLPESREGASGTMCERFGEDVLASGIGMISPLIYYLSKELLVLHLWHTYYFLVSRYPLVSTRFLYCTPTNPGDRLRKTPALFYRRKQMAPLTTCRETIT